MKKELKSGKWYTALHRMPVEEWAGILFFTAAVFLTVAAVPLCFGNDIWYDELFTMGLTGRSVKELVGFTARDVHPPFYYLYVKAVLELCKLIIPSADPVMVAKLCSVLPFLLLHVYSLWKVRKHEGMLCAGIFSFCIVGMPQLAQYMTEIRMYGLSLFLVTAAFLHACEIARCGVPADAAGSLSHGSGKETARADFLFLLLYGILAAYTHYFACVAVAMVYLWLLLSLFMKKRSGGKRLTDRGSSGDGAAGGTVGSRLKGTGICVGISAVSYLPWLYVVASQVSRIKENYWILPLGIRSLGGCVKFLLKPSFSGETVNVIIAVALFLVYAFLAAGTVVQAVKRETKQEEGIQGFFLPLSGLFVLGGVVLFGFAASFCIRPVFIYRYMLPAVGVFWLGFAVCVSSLRERKALLLPLLLLLTVTGLTNYGFYSRDEAFKREEMGRTGQELCRIAPEDKVIFNFNQMQGTLGYYLPNETFLWSDRPEELIAEMFDGQGSVEDTDTIREWLLKGETVWFVGSGNAREDVRALWREQGVESAEEADCLLERYWFRLYRLSLKQQ